MIGQRPERRARVQREAYFLEYAEQVRSRAAMPLMLTGGLRSRAAMDDALASRRDRPDRHRAPACLDPDLPRKPARRHGRRRAGQPRDLQVGVKQLDDISELGWHTTQLWRLGPERAPPPTASPALAVAEYVGQTVVGGVTRQLPCARRVLSPRPRRPRTGPGRASTGERTVEPAD